MCLSNDTITVKLTKLSTQRILWYHTLKKPRYGYVNGYQLQITAKYMPNFVTNVQWRTYTNVDLGRKIQQSSP